MKAFVIIAAGLIIFWSTTLSSYFIARQYFSSQKPQAQFDQPQKVLAATTIAPAITLPPPTPAKDVNILLLGLDARIGDNHPRCDAIHMLSISPQKGKITITSVPRGTISKDGNIIANVCSIYGINIAQKEIEKITGVKADHVAKVGFSQAQGLLRLASLPASPTLEALRARKIYPIGDNQRSYNQGVFLKDTIVNYTDWATKLPWAIQKLGYNIVDTDLSFDQAQEIFRMIQATEIYKKPDNIEVRVRPQDGFRRQEIHVQSLVSTTSDWQNDPEFKAYQNNVLGYLQAVVARSNYLIDKKQYQQANNLLITPFSQKLWLQIEDPAIRNQQYFELVKAFVFSSTDYEKSRFILNNFILEANQNGADNRKEQADELLKLLN